MSVGRKETFEVFKRDYVHNDTVEEHKRRLKQRSDSNCKHQLLGSFSANKSESVNKNARYIQKEYLSFSDPTPVIVKKNNQYLSSLSNGPYKN